MISIEKARELKEAGLKWVPMAGDSWTYINMDMVTVINCLYDFECEVRDTSDCLFIPSLSQLLAEIEARGWHYIFNGKNTISEQYGIVIANDDMFKTFEADTPEEACADALLWILEQQVSS